jgi:AcrR family transcriptional regulator
VRGSGTSRTLWQFPSAARPAPAPVQERALSSVEAALQATIELLEESPVETITFSAVRERSGVSSGSLTHHFGSREGLIAAAQVERFARVCRADSEFLSRFATRVDAAEPHAEALISLVADMLTPRRQRQRWLRMSAVAAALGDEPLAAMLREAYAVLIDATTEYVATAQRNGLVSEEFDPRAAALLATMYAQGLVLDDLTGDVAPPDWRPLQLHLGAAFATGPTMSTLHGLARQQLRAIGAAADPRSHPRPATDRTSEMMSDVDHVRRLILRDVLGVATSQAGGSEAPDAPEAPEAPVAPDVLDAPDVPGRFLAAAIDRMGVHGARGIDVRTLRNAVGWSSSRFYRTFRTRSRLVLLARTHLAVGHAAALVSELAGAVTSARTPAELHEALVTWAIAPPGSDPGRLIWQHTETLAATSTDPELRERVAAIQRISRELLVEQVSIAQARGLLTDVFSAPSVATLLDSITFWSLFHSLDAHAPDRDGWAWAVGRLISVILPDQARPSGAVRPASAA